jgi:flagellar FliJ protein
LKSFVFKLQTALNVKFKEEDIHKEKLHTATDVYISNLNLLDNLKNRLFEIQDILREKQLNTINVIEIKRVHDFIPVIRERIHSQDKVTEESRVKMEQIRAELVEIRKKRKILEKIRSRHYQAYMVEFLREEQKLIDEMATVGFVRKNSAV